MRSHAMHMRGMNFIPSSLEHEMIAGAMSPDHERLDQRGGFLDTWVDAGHAENDRIASPRDPDGLENVSKIDACIDYCFTTAELSKRVRGSDIDHDATASDHLPVWVDIDLDNIGNPLTGTTQ